MFFRSNFTVHNVTIFTEEILWFENYDLDNIITPMDVKQLKELLKATNYNLAKSEKLIEGFSKGFSLGCRGEDNVNKPHQTYL